MIMLNWIEIGNYFTDEYSMKEKFLLQTLIEN